MQSISFDDGSVHVMFVNIVSVIVPVFFVLLLGYGAGRTKAFDSDQIAGINKLVLNFALPASLFVGTIRTSRTQLLQQGPLFLVLLLTLLGFYAVVLLLSRFVFHHKTGAAALQAMCASFAAAIFYGPALLSGLYGSGSAVVISIFSIIINIVMSPVTLVLLEVSQAAEHSKAKASTASIASHAVVQSIKLPLVWAPTIAIILVLLGVQVPSLIDNMLNLLGEATAGVALFIGGLSIASRKITLNLEVGVNIVLKLVVQPALFFLLALVFSVNPPFNHIGFIATALPSGVMVINLAQEYKTYEAEASSTLALTTILMIVTLPIGLYLFGGL